MHGQVDALLVQHFIPRRQHLFTLRLRVGNLQIEGFRVEQNGFGCGFTSHRKALALLVFQRDVNARPAFRGLLTGRALAGVGVEADNVIGLVVVNHFHHSLSGRSGIRG